MILFIGRLHGYTSECMVTFEILKTHTAYLEDLQLYLCDAAVLYGRSEGITAGANRVSYWHTVNIPITSTG